MTNTAMNMLSDEKVKTRNQGSILVDHVEQFILINRPDRLAIRQLKEFFYSFISSTEDRQRRRISVALSRNHYTPRSILIFLGLEEIEIASPVLLFSKVLSEADLQNIIRRTDLAHARVIARRSHISTLTVQLLLSRDDDQDTLQKILRQNSSIQREFSEALKLGILNEAEMALWETPAAVKPFAPLSKNESESEPPVKTRDLGQGLLEMANHGNRLRHDERPKQKGPAFFQTEKLNVELIFAARSLQHDRFAEIINSACGLKQELTLEYIEQKDVGTFACLLSALEIPRSSAGRIMLLLFSHLGHDKSVFSEIMKRYDQLEKLKVVSFFTKLGAEFEVRSAAAKRHQQTTNLNLLIEHRRQSIRNFNDPYGKKYVSKADALKRA
ncbi:MAG: hypothetical protein AAF423_04880 [Pseudomonadota bacterium]